MMSETLHRNHSSGQCSVSFLVAFLVSTLTTVSGMGGLWYGIDTRYSHRNK